MYTALIDNHRRLYGIHETANAARFTGEEAAIRARGLTPSRVALAAFPTGYRRGLTLSDDGLTCTPAEEDHSSRLVAARRARVVAWAQAETDERFVRRWLARAWDDRAARGDDGPLPPLGRIWWAFAIMNLSAAARDEWLTDRDVWPAIEANIGVSAEDFLTGASHTNWAPAYSAMEALTRFYRVGQSQGSAVLTMAPVHISTATAAHLQAGSGFANSKV